MEVKYWKTNEDGTFTPLTFVGSPSECSKFREELKEDEDIYR